MLTLSTPEGVNVTMEATGGLGYGLVAGSGNTNVLSSEPLMATIAISQAWGEGVGFRFEPGYRPLRPKPLNHRVTECNITWCAQMHDGVHVVCIPKKDPGSLQDGFDAHKPRLGQWQSRGIQHHGHSTVSDELPRSGAT